MENQFKWEAAMDKGIFMDKLEEERVDVFDEAPENTSEFFMLIVWMLLF